MKRFNRSTYMEWMSALIVTGFALSVCSVLIMLTWTACVPQPVYAAEVSEPPVIEEFAVESEPEEPAPVEEPEVLPPVQEEEVDPVILEQLAVGIYREGGGDAVCDECRFRIADVMLNRVADPRYPDTLAEVLTQKSQYGTMYWEGIVWPERAKNPGEAHAVERAYRIAEEVLTHNHSDLYGQGYIFQSEFPNLGKQAVECCGIYYAKG